MLRIKIVVILLLICGALFFADTRGKLPSALLSIWGSQRPTATPKSTFRVVEQPLPAQFAAVEPDQILYRASRFYHAEKIVWADIKIRQRSYYQDMTYDVNGRFLCAPGQRLRLELTPNGKNPHGSLLIVCDGEALQRSFQFPGSPADVTTTPLPRRKTFEDNVAEIARAREAILRRQAFRGVGPLLEDIRRNIRQPQLRAVATAGRLLLEIKGRWRIDKEIAVETDIEINQTIRECRLYMDAKTLWPYRVQWWGAAEGQSNTLLLESEYDDPVLDRPLPPERMTKEFVLQLQKTTKSSLPAEKVSFRE